MNNRFLMSILAICVAALCSIFLWLWSSQSGLFAGISAVEIILKSMPENTEFLPEGLKALAGVGAIANSVLHGIVVLAIYSMVVTGAVIMFIVRGLKIRRY